MLDHAPTPAKNRDVEPRGARGTYQVQPYRDSCLAVQTRQATTHLDDDELS